MSSAKPFPIAHAVDGFLSAIKANPDGWPASDYQRLKKALEPIEGEIVMALAGTPCKTVNGWLEFSVLPHADFKAKGHALGTPVDIDYSLKSGHFTASVATTFRFGIVDLHRFVWELRAPHDQSRADLRLYALIGRACVQAFAVEARKTAKEAA
jgi:hypothetical protein